MRTLAMTVGLDNTIIWLVRMTDGTNTYRLSTEDITLDANDWDGKALGVAESRFSLNEIGKRINIPEGGTSGEVSTVTFTISRNILNPLLNSFFDEFYPATSGKILVSINVEVGIIWQGATTEAEITWLHKYNVDDYSYDVSNIGLINSEFSEFENFMIPYYKVQDEVDNGMSYYPAAPPDNFDITLPIVYGSFNGAFHDNVDTIFFKLSPSVLVNQYSMQVFIASHPVKTTSVSLSAADEYNVYKYINSANTYMTCFKNDDTFGFNTVKYWVQLTGAVADTLLGNLSIPLREVSAESNIIEIENISNDDITDYDELDANVSGDEQLVMNAGINVSTSDIGYCGTANQNIALRFLVSSNDAGSRSFNIGYKNNMLSTPVESSGTNGSVTGTGNETKNHFFGDSVIGKKDTIIPWEIEEVLALDFRIRNLETTAGNKIRIYRATINFYNMKVNGLFRGRRVSLRPPWDRWT